MKNLLRLAVVTCMLLGMLLAAIPASAGTKTEITGTMTSLDQYNLPPEREWGSWYSVWHWRNETLVYQQEASDSRLNGYVVTSNNGEYHFTSEGDLLFLHIYNHSIIYAEEGFLTPLWACMSNGIIIPEFYLYSECHGIGSNAGLVAHLTIFIGDMSFEGEIQEP